MERNNKPKRSKKGSKEEKLKAKSSSLPFSSPVKLDHTSMMHNVRKASRHYSNTKSVASSVLKTNVERKVLEEFGKKKEMLQKAAEYIPTKTKKKERYTDRRKNKGVARNMLNEVRALISEALENEEQAPYGRTKLMFVGEGRAGKTSTIKALLNKKFDPAEGSTKGFDVSRVDARAWKEDEGSYLVEHLQKLVEKKKKNKKSKKGKNEEKLGKIKEVNSKKSTLSISKEEAFKYGKELVLNNGSDNPLSFSIWDFGGQKVFYTLHHLFLTEFGCYILVFNLNKLLETKTRHETIDYLRFWLFSKKIHAPAAPILLAGTRSTELSEEKIKKVNYIIKKQVLGLESFNEISNDKLWFFPVDNRTGAGIDELRNKIEEVVRGASYTKEEVPVSFLRALQLFLDQNKSYLTIEEAQRILSTCGLEGELQDVALEFLNQRGLIVYFSEPQALREFVMLQPQWMIEALTDVFFDFELHDPPKYSDEFNREFRRFEAERIMSKDLLKNIWDLKGYSEKVQEFFLNLMEKSSLVCNYKFDNEESFLVPSLFASFKDSIRRGSILDAEEEYQGPYFVLDFSGNYDENILKDNGATYVRYLPFGVYERLVCLCVEYSGTFKGSITPRVKAKCCQLSFGVGVDFELRVETDDNGSPLQIKVATESDAEMDDVKELVKKIYAMVEGLKEDFFSKSTAETKLAISLLIPSSKESGQHLAEYNTVKVAREEASSLSEKIRPNPKNSKKVKLENFNQWFEESGSPKEDLTNPDANFKAEFTEDAGLGNIETLSTMKALPENCKYHCFLSYKQKSAIDMVGKQYFILTQKGFKCWYDQQFSGSITLKNMQDGVRDSMCYILFLSKDIFPSPYVEAEVTMALELKKPIILLHHPDTGSRGYWSFSDYINSAPDIVKPLFAKIESIQLQRRYYLEQAVTEEVVRRLGDISQNWYNK